MAAALLTQGRLSDAVKARGAFFKANKETLTMKQARRTLEQDIGLSPKCLDAEGWKQQVASLVDKALFGESENEIVSTSEAVSPAKHRAPEQPEAQVEGEAYADSKAGDASEDSDEERPQKKAKKSSQKETAAAPKKAAAVSRGSSARATELKKTLAACTIKVPPTTYTKCASEEEFVTRLEGLLAKEGLGANPSREQIVKVKRRLEQARELDGIDVSNVIQPGSRRRAAQNHVLFAGDRSAGGAAGAAPKPAPKRAASSDSSDVSSDSDDCSEEEDSDGSIGNSDSDEGRIDTSSKSKSGSRSSGAGLPVRTQQMPVDDDRKKPVAAPAVKTVVVKAAAASATAPAAAAAEQKAELAKMEAAARGRRTFVIDDSDDE